jgi:hypothetical protein
MTPLLKLADQPEHFTIVLNKEEHELLNYLVEDKLKWCRAHLHRAPELGAVINGFVDIEHKLNSITPPPN